MFGEINGLPVHALVVHVVVVAAPCAALLGIAFLVPKWRRWLQWPLIAVSAIAVVATFVAKESGQTLQTAISDQLGGVTGRLVATHANLANELLIGLIVMLVLAIAAVVTYRLSGSGWLRMSVAVIVAAAAIVVVVLTYQTGEAGAQARWNPDGSVNYSGN
jgi:uncharacterized membrane protein